MKTGQQYQDELDRLDMRLFDNPEMIEERKEKIYKRQQKIFDAMERLGWEPTC